MRIRTLGRLISLVLFGLLLPASPALKETTAAALQSEGWVSFAPPEEEIAIQIPALPIVRNFPISNQRERKPEEKVLAHHAYNGYGSGLVYVIDSFKAEHPEKLSAEKLGLADKQGVFERLFFDGVEAQLFRNTVNHRYAPYSKRTVRFVTDNHLYLIQLMSLEEFSPAVDQFLSSIKLRKSADQSVAIEDYKNTAGGPVFNSNELTRRAIIVWKSEPWYTQLARERMTKGTVILDVVLGENGYVSQVAVVQGLDNGLTEAAIEAARNIRFFPAEKDGKPVSQRNRLEYSFNVY
jgi:TonB family protein